MADGLRQGVHTGGVAGQLLLEMMSKASQSPEERIPCTVIVMWGAITSLISDTT